MMSARARPCAPDGIPLHAHHGGARRATGPAVGDPWAVSESVDDRLSCVDQQMNNRACRYTGHPFAWPLAGLMVLMLVAWPAQSSSPTAGTAGLSDVNAILEAIAESPFDEPIHLESEEEAREVHGRVHVVVDAPLGDLKAALDSARDWCEILFLHINVKACVHHGRAGDERITLYIGRKRYQDPEVVERVELRFHTDRLDDERLAIRLQADLGPHGLRAFDMKVQAVALEDERSLLLMRYSIGYGAMGRFTLGIYLALGGRDRIGFTVERLDEDGTPVYVDGLRGLIERNTVRFFFALQAYLEEPDDLEARLGRWWDLADRHPEQLREPGRDSYLAQKRRERRNQEALQARIDAGGDAGTGGAAHFPTQTLILPDRNPHSLAETQRRGGMQSSPLQWFPHVSVPP
jgi:hypothetical protein